MGHKSPSSLRWAMKQEAQDLLIHRRMVKAAHRLGTHSHWPDSMPRPNEYESAGHYHWRMLHKNLAKPILKTGWVQRTLP